MNTPAPDTRVGEVVASHAEVVVERATAADIDAITRTMIDAFFHNPDVAWLAPETDSRRSLLQRFVPALLAHVLEIGIVDTVPDRTAAALWWDHHALDPDKYAAIVEATCHPYQAAMLHLAAFLAAREPGSGHAYLAYLGVAPHRQRQGVGTALLRHHHAALDCAGQPAYLVATTPTSRDLYGRHGYLPEPDGPIDLPDGGPRLWPMWRPPAAPTTVRPNPGPSTVQPNRRHNATSHDGRRAAPSPARQVTTVGGPQTRAQPTAQTFTAGGGAGQP